MLHHVDLRGRAESILGCQIASFPVKYLGLPLSTTRVPKAQLQGVVNKIADKLPPWQGPLMARSGRLVWIKSVLMAVPTYTLMAEKLPSWVRAEIDSICRRFLWAGKDGSTRGKCMVAWPTVCRPIALGGLGVTDLRLAGYALQTHWLWLQRTDRECA